MAVMRWTLALSVVVACARGIGPVPPNDDDVGPPREPEMVAADWRDARAAFDAQEQWSESACAAMGARFASLRRPDGSLSARAVYMTGLVASRCGDAESAEAHYERALQLAPNLCEPRVGLGVQALEGGDVPRATGLFREAVRRDLRCAPAYLNLAVIESRQPSGHDAAIANLRRALAVRADYPEALDRLALIYLEQAEAQPERLDLAAVVCQQALRVAPDYAPIHNTWALVDIARGDLTSASARLTRATELDPELFEAHMNFGQLTLSQRAYTEAERAFRRARALRPRSYDAAVGLGVALRGLGRADDAEQLYRAAIGIDGARPEAYFDLAVLYQEHREGTVGELQRAEAYLGDFAERARRSDTHADALADVVRWCEGSRRCRPGRAQNVHDALVAYGTREDAQRPTFIRGSRGAP